MKKKSTNLEVKPIKRRNAAETKERILRAGMVEFGNKGFGGARIESIVKKAQCNIRMLYHYYGGKQDLYLACLGRVYINIRLEEQRLNLTELAPKDALEKLVKFTFEHMQNNPDFIRIAGVENTQGGKFIKKLPLVTDAANELIKTMDIILERGAKDQVFREGIDAFQLYVSILSLSYLHLSNQPTLSITYDRDLGDKQWLLDRKAHVRDMILSYVEITPIK